ncbi:MAG TPA: AIR synthase-related protein, partial [Ignavibacteria bacterium]|nr:AIR synthase-related protein [Ignavibacteria bacterium]
YDLVKGDAPEIDLEMESNLVRALIQLANTKSINSAHDVSDGGLAVCIAESCMINRTLPIGCSVNIEYNGRPDFWLFNESQGRAVISFNSQNEENVKKICNENNIVYLNIGKTGGEAVVINKEVKIPLEIAKDAYYNSISQIMEN